MVLCLQPAVGELHLLVGDLGTLHLDQYATSTQRMIYFRILPQSYSPHNLCVSSSSLPSSFAREETIDAPKIDTPSVLRLRVPAFAGVLGIRAVFWTFPTTVLGY
jgi:hypothetical protein